MSEYSTSGPLDSRFISEEEIHSSWEELPGSGINMLVKTKRQGRWFILKGLKPEFRGQPVYLELLKKEYALMVQLDHPNIAKAYAKETNDRLGPCIVMEYIDGVRLDAFLSGKPTREARLKLVGQLSDALCYIHSKQILHRDLKPANILVTLNGGNIKIIDFGLSDSDDYAILKQPAGTLKYMSPEQEAGKNIDCRSDIYSFGLLLRELFPHRYCRIRQKCINKDPQKRFESMEAVKKAIERSDRRRRFVPFLCFGAALALALFYPFIHPSKHDNRTEDLAESVTADQKAYLQKALWRISAPLHELIKEADEGKEYREVLMSKLTKMSIDIHSKITDAGNFYSPGDPERLYFLSQCSMNLDTKKNWALKSIENNCRSFEAEFSKGRISKTAYDSLKWVVSPNVVTLPATDISATAAVCGAGLLDSTYAAGAQAGLCWGPCHNPTAEGRHALLDWQEGRMTLTNLAPGSTYFIRGYVLTAAGITYGNEVSFTTAVGKRDVPEGAAVGLFSVSDSSQVYFSKGNLQYQATTQLWRFAPQQYDFVGIDNNKISPTWGGWIDLFGWGTSGHGHGAVNYQPWSGNSDTRSDALHCAYGNPGSHLFEQDGTA
ncbi:MAG: serine/threonine protein kinase, partial [Bacteroidales bacterium]|nr:serine/threonine protein kinase [Bacteroidales bacterium]